MKRSLTTKAPFLLALALVLALGFQATAEESQATDPQQPEQTQLTEDGYLATSVAGVQIFIDPETGRMRPPSEAEAAQLAAAMQQMFGKPLKSGYAPVEHADGSVSMVVGADYLSLSVLHIGEDGQLHTECVDDLHTALDAIDRHTTDAAPVAQRDEE